ncbi:ParB/RepB/Spo0J family partition protein [Salipiger abyssi]|uniref:ParB/RepB/Spo0J family partition protein n=1 Tax=Salipiger abyssi TaxID=1250539 RepID=UPI001A8CF91B|nr:ParB/RepB/Spo0J family partition protein [Salipiger abyssi]MBN9890148.1 ParB/RepB/Spo0J family partition protein [Salipiger abyssi]
MHLNHIDINDLTVSPQNVRKYGATDCADLVTSIRALGVLQPLLVRPSGAGFEVVAGQRRLNACRIIAEDCGIDPLPCLIMEAGDDAAAIEASLAENIERLPMDEIDQYKAFAALVKQGRSAEEIAARFGITERMVAQRLALGRLHPPILTAYRKGELHARDLRSLTLASPKQQKAWWALVKDEDAYAPTGQRLKDWLFGGAHIPVSNARFDVEASGLAIVADLFGEESYFANSEAFWALQNAAIAELAERHRAKGWAEVAVLEIGEPFYTWDHIVTAKEDGGKLFVTCTQQGEVAVHEGYLTQTEAKRRAKAEAGETVAAKPELTKPAQNYFALHRHAAVRNDLLTRPDIGLRLIVVHMLTGSALWTVHRDAQRAAKPEIAESLAENKAQQAFETERAEMIKLLGLETERVLPADDEWWHARPDAAQLLAHLMTLDDAEITRILTLLMAESLAAGSQMVEHLADQLGTDMGAVWSPDETFLTLIRDKQALSGMVAELAGDMAAKEHLTATAKTQKLVIRACLDGTRKPKVAHWLPRYMAVPMAGYTERSGFPERAEQEAPEIAIAAE